MAKGLCLWVCLHRRRRRLRSCSKYYIGRGAGELSHSDDWTLYYRDYSPTASISYTFIQQLHFSGAYQTNDSGGSFGVLTSQ